MYARAAQLGHDLLSRQLRRVLFDLIFLGQRLSHLPEGPALHQGQGPQGFLAAHQHAQQTAWRGACRNLVVARLDQPVLARQAKPGVEQLRVGLRTRSHHITGHAARGGAGLNRQLQRLGTCGQGLVQPPCGSGAAGDQ